MPYAKFDGTHKLPSCWMGSVLDTYLKQTNRLPNSTFNADKRNRQHGVVGLTDFFLAALK